jgi:gamma-glutamyl hercynylcysteine S-oxide synthase
MIRRLHSFRKWCWLTFSVGLVGAVYGVYFGGNRLQAASGLTAMIGTVLLIAARRWRFRNRRAEVCGVAAPGVADSSRSSEPPDFGSRVAKSDAPSRRAEDAPRAAATPECRIQEFVDTLMREGRYALPLRPQIAAGLPAHLLATAQSRLEQQMAIVPAGDVVVEPHLTVDEPISDAEIVAAHGQKVHVEATLLDRFAVTNRQFQIFVNAGGYDQMTLWDAAIWPAVVDFVDATGHQGPRYWQHGRFPPGKADHPVVGISWYEASAYARWVGKRLPTDAEWLKAGCSPVQLSPTSHVQRRFPWGNSMDRNRANLWGTGAADTTTVDDYGSGASVGGICQLIGNVWEWTAADFELPAQPKKRRDAAQPSIGFAAAAASGLSPYDTHGAHGEPCPSAAASSNPTGGVAAISHPPLKTLRGGAFDTYFDHHAACQFASADSPLARKYNIGFRLAISASDLIAGIKLQERSPTEIAAIADATTDVPPPHELQVA